MGHVGLIRSKDHRAQGGRKHISSRHNLSLASLFSFLNHGVVTTHVTTHCYRAGSAPGSWSSPAPVRASPRWRPPGPRTPSSPPTTSGSSMLAFHTRAASSLSNRYNSKIFRVAALTLLMLNALQNPPCNLQFIYFSQPSILQNVCIFSMSYLVYLRTV